MVGYAGGKMWTPAHNDEGGNAVRVYRYRYVLLLLQNRIPTAYRSLRYTDIAGCISL